MNDGGRPGLDLVLAFDASASVNFDEFDLMIAGTAAALADPGVQSAIAGTPGGIRLAIIEWSSIRRQVVSLPWTPLSRPGDTARLARRVAGLPRRLEGGGTMIHAGLAFAAAQFPAARARRQVIDVAGNGMDDDDVALHELRPRLAARGITVNALSVREDHAWIHAYYRDNVIIGPGAFAIEAASFESFARAMRLKLLREISGPRLS